jgi:pantoate--beta-alanine ligase
MDTIQSLMEMYRRAAQWQRQGLKIALVPTMGCLHEGHLSLMRKARDCADRVIVSIFVNPMQFGPHEDFDAYPRQLQSDCLLAQKEGVDTVFCPEPKAMYGENFQTTISVKGLSQGMCGADRPGHFDGVATVVTKLLHLTVPDVAIFGEKDFQQLAIIKQLVADLNLPVQIVGCPIVREADGLAMSSRNKYLQGEARSQALCLYRAILAARDRVASGKEDVTAASIVAETARIVAEAGAKLEYAVVVNDHTLQPEVVIGNSSVLALAAKIGGVVRLIDNAKLYPSPV